MTLPQALTPEGIRLLRMEWIIFHSERKKKPDYQGKKKERKKTVDEEKRKKKRERSGSCRETWPVKMVLL